MKTDGGIKVVVELDTEGYSKSELEKARLACMDIFRERIVGVYGYAPNIIADSDPARIRIEVAGARNEHTIAQLLLQTANLRFCETLTLTDLGAGISTLYLSAERRSEFRSLRAPSDSEGYLPVIAYALAKDTARIIQFLSEQEIQNQLGTSVQFLWGAKPVNQYGEFELIAVQSSKNRGDQLTSQILGSAESIQDNGQIAVSIQFTERGAEDWFKFTGKNVNRSIAIVMDNLVYSYPLVNEAIPGGETLISGDFTHQEAMDLSSLLNAGRLPIGAKIVSIKSVRGAGK